MYINDILNIRDRKKYYIKRKKGRDSIKAKWQKRIQGNKYRHLKNIFALKTLIYFTVYLLKSKRGGGKK